MKTIFNFYLLYEDEDDSYEDLLTGIETEDLIYLTLQAGDYVVLPDDENSEFIVSKVVKNISNHQIDIYVSKLKGAEEIFGELETFASKTLQTMFDSIKANIDDINKDKIEDTKETYLEDVSYEEMKENK